MERQVKEPVDMEMVDKLSKGVAKVTHDFFVEFGIQGRCRLIGNELELFKKMFSLNLIKKTGYEAHHVSRSAVAERLMAGSFGKATKADRVSRCLQSQLENEIKELCDSDESLRNSSFRFQSAANQLSAAFLKSGNDSDALQESVVVIQNRFFRREE